MDMTHNDKGSKYIGSCCGNKFVIVDCRNIEMDARLKADVAARSIVKTGVDSALFIEKSENHDLSMRIYERDGSESESCGNGVILIAHLLNLSTETVEMSNNTATIDRCSERLAILMSATSSCVEEIEADKHSLFVKLGEPHIVYFSDDLEHFDLVGAGIELQRKYPKGINVDVIQRQNDDQFLIRTFERGVLAETKSCGTGSLSAYAAISHLNGRHQERPIEFLSSGGSHWVSKKNEMFRLETLAKYCIAEIVLDPSGIGL